MIKEGFSGLLFNPLDQQQLQVQRYKMISNQELRKSFGLHLQEFILNNYSKEFVMNQLMEKYKTY